MATIPLNEPTYRGSAGPAFLAAGFRPFFLFAAIQAAFMVPLWLAIYSGGANLSLPFSPVLWHGHEMVFGFAAAALGGFLLTAVPNWTGCRTVSGLPLAILFGLWLAGRAAFLAAGVLPPLVVAIADLSYVPVLGGLLAMPLIRAGKPRNMAFLVILSLFWAANLMVHAEIVLGADTGLKGVWLGVVLLLVMIAIVGGRIIPSFTQNWLRMQGMNADTKSCPRVEKGGAQASVLVSGLLAVFLPDSPVTAIALLVAAAIHMKRLSGWRGLATWRNPILGVLHLGYLWLVAGLALLGLANFGLVPASAALHALTAGAIGTLIIGVMSRAALGHAGRPLVVAKPVVAAYGLISLGTVLRVTAPFLGDAQMGLTHAGGAIWALAWVIFAIVYFPIVTGPRADGRPG